MEGHAAHVRYGVNPGAFLRPWRHAQRVGIDKALLKTAFGLRPIDWSAKPGKYPEFAAKSEYRENERQKNQHLGQ